MEHDYYEVNLENWANSIIDLEENKHDQYSNYHEYTPVSNGSLIPLGPATYYRSKAFSSQVGINPIINAADPLLTLISKLKRITIPPVISVFYQNICHELKAFENKAQTSGYHSQLISAARYILCSTLDDLLSLLFPTMDRKKYSFVDTFHEDVSDENLFFLILERSSQDPSGHIDLLELIYICLRLGFEGKYRGLDRGYLELRYITERLYQVISQYRDEFSRNLFISFDMPNLHPINKKNYLHLLPPAWTVSTLTVVLLFILFVYFYTKLLESASPVSQFINASQIQNETEIKAL
jgi:type VI secretion system protein ImpK